MREEHDVFLASLPDMEAEAGTALGGGQHEGDPFSGATGYHRIAVEVMEGLSSAAPHQVVVNVRNQGSIADLEDDALEQLAGYLEREAAARRESSSISGARAAPLGTASGPKHFAVAQQTEASFTVREKLTRLPAPSDAIGRTPYGVPPRRNAGAPRNPSSTWSSSTASRTRSRTGCPAACSSASPSRAC